MTFEAFEELQKRLLEKASAMRDTKGKEYVRSGNDRLDNFKRIARIKKVQPETVLGIYMQKHVDSVDNYVDGLLAGEPVWETASEPIEGRIVDIITYYTLLAGLIAERQGKMIEGRKGMDGK
jgi:hypothetical protein